MPVYFVKGLTSGSAGDLDALGIDKTNGPTGQVLDLLDRDVAVYADGTNVFFYSFHIADTDAESVPSVIRPNDYSTAGVWKLVTYGSGSLIDADKLDSLNSDQFLRSDVADQVDGVLTFAESPVLNNNKYLSGKETGGTVRYLIAVNTSDHVEVGNPNNPINIRTNGTLQYNSATLPSGSFTTTDGKTVTVTDGLITSIV